MSKFTKEFYVFKQVLLSHCVIKTQNIKNYTSESIVSGGLLFRIGAVAVDAGPPVLLFPKIRLLIPIDFFFSISAMSPITILTSAYSINDKKTNTVQPDMKTSMALIYETGGNDF